MSFFRQPKPRRFHHEPIYYDEHSDRVKQITERAKKELGMEARKEFNPEDIRGAFTSGLKEKRKSKRLGNVLANTGAIIVIILVLLLVWIYLEQ